MKKISSARPPRSLALPAGLQDVDYAKRKADKRDEKSKAVTAFNNGPPGLSSPTRHRVEAIRKMRPK